MYTVISKRHLLGFYGVLIFALLFFLVMGTFFLQLSIKKLGGGERPNCLRVIRKDFRNKLYPASSLRDRTWLDMKDKLESLGVKVRNECI